MNTNHALVRLGLFLLVFLICARILPAQPHQPLMVPSKDRYVDEDAMAWLISGPTGGRSDEQPVVSLAPPALKGPHAIAIKVIDRITGDPIRDYQIHGGIWLKIDSEESEEDSSGADEDWSGFSARVARIESKSVETKNGVSQYKGLAKGDYEFQAEAEGFLPAGTRVAVPGPEEPVVIKLDRPRSIKGRLVTADTGEPVEELEIELGVAMDPDSQTVRTWEPIRAESDGEGRFEFSGAPPGQYQIASRHLPNRLGDLNEIARQSERTDAADLSGQARSAAFRELLRRVYESPHYAMPKSKFNPGAELDIDIGDVKMPRAPMLDVELVDESGSPTPYEDLLITIEDERFSNSTLKTDQDGKAIFPVLGWTEGAKVRVTAGRPDRFFRAEDKRAFVIVSPKMGERLPVKIQVKSKEGALPVRLTVSAKETGKPVPRIDVLICRNSSDAGSRAQFYPWDALKRQQNLELQPRESESPDGRHVLKAIEIDEEFRRAQAELDKARAENKSASDLDRMIRYASLALVIAAPGRAIEVFALPVEKLLRGDEFTLELEPEAIVCGRVTIGPNNEPATPANLRRLVNSETGAPKNRQPIDGTSLRVQLLNESLDTVEDRMLRGERRRSRPSALLDDEGRFEIGYLLPAEHWAFQIDIPGLPPYKKLDLKLEPGMNDLGDLAIGGSGNVIVLVRNESGEPIPKTYFALPTQNQNMYRGHETRPPFSDETGIYELMGSALGDDRQILRISPPWGYQAAQNYLVPPENFNICFEAELAVDRSKEATFGYVLPQGRTLKVRVAPSEMVGRAAVFYSDPLNVTSDAHGVSEPEFFFAICGATLMARSPDSQGLTYYQSHRVPEPGLALSAEPVELTIPHVPAGPMALRLDGAVYYRDASKNDAANLGEYLMSNPIGYLEFEMPDADFKIDARPGPVEARVHLEPPAAKGLEPMFVLERVEPTTLAFGPDTLSIISVAGAQFNRDLDAMRLPFIAYLDGFTDKMTQPRDAQLFCLPTGKWRIRVFDSLFAMMGAAPKPYYTREFEAPASGEMRIDVPPPPDK